MTPITIELISGWTNAEPWKIVEKLVQDHLFGQKLPSPRVVGSLNARATSHQIGNSVQATTTRLAAPQRVFRPVGRAGRARAAVLAAGAATAVISVAPMRSRARRCQSP